MGALGYQPPAVFYSRDIHHSLGQRASNTNSYDCSCCEANGVSIHLFSDICPLLQNATMGRKKDRKGHDVGNILGVSGWQKCQLYIFTFCSKWQDFQLLSSEHRQVVSLWYGVVGSFFDGSQGAASVETRMGRKAGNWAPSPSALNGHEIASLSSG